MKKLNKILIMMMLAILVLPLSVVKADEKEPVNIYVFRSDTCPHCINTMNFLEEIKEEYGQYFKVYDYEVSNQENSELYEEVASFMGDTAGGVPYIVIGKYTYPNGFEPDSNATTDQTMGEQLIERIMEIYNSDERYDVMEELNNKPNYNTVVGVVSVVVIVGIAVMAVISRRQSRED